ncbi:MAG TPA: hypothetical protein VFE41_03000 [Acetobacteraceae bacterium]|jgi:hypothetical protein|nr:hypothetical protein [Acetobacteraceae bacterium]
MLHPCRPVLVLGMLLVALTAADTWAAATSDPTPAATAPADPTPGAPPEATPPPVSIDGFRSAHFGMTEAEVRKAIETDFKLSGSAVRPGDNPVERTHLLSVTVPDLVPDSGKAVIDYVLGYKSHGLIEVNVTWSTAADTAIKPTTLLHTGGTLQGYFQSEAFPAGQTAVNAMLANGSLLMFRGTDPAGHTVVLVLSGPVRQDPKDHKAQMTPAVLSLVYAIDPAHPDVFRLQKGTF